MNAIGWCFTIVGILLALGAAFYGYVWFKKRSRARQAAREKLLKEQNESYDTTMPSNKEYRNVYKKAVLKADASVTSTPTAKAAQAAPKPVESSLVSAASDLESGQVSKRSATITDEEVFNVVLQSWYEHLIRHSQTDYLRTIVKNSSGMTTRDLIPEMRMLLEAIPNVPLSRWSALSASDKAAISTAAVSLKPRITQSVGKRFKLAVA